MRILVACEESQAITKELRKLGHDAFSCDLLPCSGGHPEWHFQEDVFKIIDNQGGILQNGEMNVSADQWEMMIAHPPCTFLAVSGARWYYHPEDKDMPVQNRRPHPRFPNRANDRDEALEFFIKLCEAPIKKIAVENPVGIVNTKYKKPTQTVHPWMFGDEASKATCLWLKNLPKVFINILLTFTCLSFSIVFILYICVCFVFCVHCFKCEREKESLVLIWRRR